MVFSLNVFFAFAADLNSVRLSINPSSNVIVNVTKLTFTITGAPTGQPICITDSLSPNDTCFQSGADSTGTLQFSATDDAAGQHVYGVKINGQIAPAASFTMNVTSGSGGSGSGSGGAGATCDASKNTGCSAGNHCDAEGGICVPDNVTPDTGKSGSSSSSPNASASSGACGDPKLEFKNGICLPKQTCTSGSLNCVNSLSELITTVIKILLFFAGSVAVLFVIIGGFWYITAQGNTEQAEKGKTALVNAIIGIVLVSLAYVIIVVISNALASRVG